MSVANHSNQHKTQKIGFILLRGFTMLSFASVIEVMRMTNYLSQSELYSWHVYQDQDDACASNGLHVANTIRKEELFECDIVFVCGGIHVQTATTASIKQLLQQLAAQGNIILGGLCTGSIALALANLMDGYHSAVHWESLPAAKEAFLKVKFGEQLYVIDKDRYTCSGGTAAIDMMLQLVRLQHGKALGGQMRIGHADAKQAQCLAGVRSCKNKSRLRALPQQHLSKHRRSLPPARPEGAHANGAAAPPG